MKLQMFRCAVCKAGPAVVGFWCFCAGSATPELQPLNEPEANAILTKAPEVTHGPELELEFEREYFVRPVAAITTTANYVPRPVNAFAQFVPEPQPFIVRMPLTSAALLTSYPTTTTTAG